MSEQQEINDQSRTITRPDEQMETNYTHVKGEASGPNDKLREMFDAIDTDKDGRLSLDELIKWYHLMGLNPTQQEVKAVLDECDTNGSTFIEFNEYKDKLKTRMDTVVEERDSLMDAFRTLDKKGDGTISCLTLRTVLTKTGDYLDDLLIDEIYQDMNVKKDGMLIYKDLVGRLCMT